MRRLQGRRSAPLLVVPLATWTLGCDEGRSVAPEIGESERVVAVDSNRPSGGADSEGPVRLRLWDDDGASFEGEGETIAQAVESLRLAGWTDRGRGEVSRSLDACGDRGGVALVDDAGRSVAMCGEGVEVVQSGGSR